MKKAELFGGWVVEHWLGFSCLGLAASFVFFLIIVPKGVTLTEKEFKCIAASPNGLTTRCDLYERRVK